MSKELITQPDFNAQLADLDRIQDTCKKLLQTKHYQNIGEAGIHAIMARAKALGIHPFEALNGGFFCINGKVGMSTEMMAALIRQRGHSIQKDPKSTNECVILHGKRADNGDTWTCTFSKADAEAAGLWNSATWKKYPGIMLYNRAMSQLFRQLFPDLSLGAGYVEDEIKEITKTGDYAELKDAEYVVKPAEKAQKKKPETVDVKPLYIEDVKPAEELKPKPISINTEQVIELAGILNECDPTYYKKFMDFYKKSVGLETLDDLPASRFDEAMASAWKNRESYQASLKTSPVETA